MNNSNAGNFYFGQVQPNYLNPNEWVKLENIKSSYTNPNEAANSFQFRTNSKLFNEEETEENENSKELIDAVYSAVDHYLKVFDEKILKHDPTDPADNNKKSLSGLMSQFRDNIEKLLRLLKGNRYPVLALIGRRGCGKSSFINALVGQLIAEPGHIRAQTGKAKVLLYRRHDKSGIDVLDTRGINEGEKPQEDDVAETAVGKKKNK